MTWRPPPAPALLALAAVLAAPAVARADGLPLVNVDAGPTGVAAAGGGVRYVTTDAARGSVVAAVERTGGALRHSVALTGHFTIPAVAFDGSASGLSADGTTLVLIRPRAAFPRRETAFALFDAPRLRLLRIVTLHGDFSFDALSPDGRTMFLIQYTSPTDPTRYRVRAFSVRAGRLEPGAIVDPRERGEAMRGLPITRATSPDGRWDYTLYDGAGKHPFIHALDTAGRRAACIDMPWPPATTRNIYALRLRLSRDARTLTVVDGARRLAAIDTAALRVRPAASNAGRSGTPRSFPPLLAVLIGAASLLVLSLLRFGRAGSRPRAPASRPDRAAS